MRIAAAILVLALAPASAGAQADATDRVARMVAAIERAGCVVTEANQDAIIRDSGLSSEQPGLAMQALFAQGRVQVEGQSLRLIAPGCPEAAGLPPAPEAIVRLVGAIRDAGCVIPLSALDSRLNGPEAETGLRDDLGRLTATGLAGFSQPGLAYALSPALCDADDAALAQVLAQVPTMLDLPERERRPGLPATLAVVMPFAQALRVQPGCSLPQRAARALTDRDVLGRHAGREPLGLVIERAGIARPQGEAVVLDGDLCAAAPAALPALLRARLAQVEGR